MEDKHYPPGVDIKELWALIDLYESYRKYFLSIRVRRHKKKRIDKKWEKRYGYRMLP